MDTWLIILLVSIVVILLLVLNGYLNMRNVKSLSEEEFKKDLRKVQLVDLREKEKYEHGHIMGARNIPMMNFSMKLQSLRKDTPIYLYDQTGRLSIRAAKMLKKKGYTDVYMLKNGISKWTGKIKSKTK
ncbi:rhodanese-like domain-containing protein [Corticicoccus populi]|uniref:Rhodanese-like domain-containing protein n=1 Tax=Corticicoccus populi TaxID=1812821 RepID=A0ABW5WRH1_9STAP